MAAGRAAVHPSAPAERRTEGNDGTRLDSDMRAGDRTAEGTLGEIKLLNVPRPSGGNPLRVPEPFRQIHVRELWVAVFWRMVSASCRGLPRRPAISAFSSLHARDVCCAC